VDEAFARAHPCTGDRLHLEMQEAPIDHAAPGVWGGGAPPE
jgi:hypothetical protein